MLIRSSPGILTSFVLSCGYWHTNKNVILCYVMQVLQLSVKYMQQQRDISNNTYLFISSCTAFSQKPVISSSEGKHSLNDTCLEHIKTRHTNGSVIPAPIYSLPGFKHQWVFGFNNNLKFQCWYLSFLLGDSGNEEVSRDSSVNAGSMGICIKPWRYRLVIEGFINITTSKMTNSVSAIVLQSDCFFFLVKFISIEYNVNFNGERHSHSRVWLN